MEKKKTEKIFLVLAFIGIYLLSTGISYAAFNFLRKGPKMSQQADLPQEEGQLLDTSGPKTEVCPLNGKMYTVEEKESWEKRRPLTVMVENHLEARPQSGMSRADVIYEAVAEGGITRFLLVYFCDAQAVDTTIGPVRSARTYYLDWASEYGEYPLYAHVGGAHCDPETGHGCLNGAKADALGQISDYGWEGANDMNQFSIGYPTFWRDYERIGHTVATEHTMYSTTEKLWKVAEEREWTNTSPDGDDWMDSFVPWSFKDGEGGAGEATKISFNFWEEHKDYSVTWEYDSENNNYKRFNGDKEHKDLNNDQQLTTENVVVLFQKESSANDGYPGNLHLLYGTIGQGEALVFQNGKAIKGKWSKADRTSRTELYDSSGKEIEFVRGKIWLEILPKGTEVDY
jgi:hypothetical protein